MGGEGATPYEVLLHAALVGETTRFTRQDGVEQTWRIMQPLLDAPPPVHVYAPGSWGPAEADALVAGPRPLARALARVVSERPEGGGATPAERRGALAVHRRSPTTPSSRTATPVLLSRPTAASAGSAFRASTRRACSARCSTGRRGTSDSVPFGINHPAARHYEPGTNVLVTTWKTPSGWVVVRDALTMGPTSGDDDDHAAHASARRRRRGSPARAHGRMPRRLGRDRDRLRADLRLRQGAGEWTLADGRSSCSRRDGRGPCRSPLLGPRAWYRRRSRARAAHARRGREGVLRAVVGGGARMRRRAWKTPKHGLRPPLRSGATGSPGRAFRTTAGVTPSSARHSRSRA